MTDPALAFAWYATAVVLAPLFAALAVYVTPGRRAGAWICVLVALGLFAPLLGMADRLLAAGPQRFAFGGHDTALGIELYGDGLALAMLWLTNSVMLAVHVYTNSWLRLAPAFRATEFRTLVLLLWSGLNALFLAADLFNIYVTLEILTLTAVPLVVLRRGAAAVAAAMQYLLFALVGSVVYLLGVALVYAHTGVLALAALAPGALEAPTALIALLLMTAGLAMKAALFPVHAWLPRAHAVAPSPASALLSALVAKAAAYLIVRLWLGPYSGLGADVALQGLAGIGVAGIVYGSLQALRQPRLKGVIAYSTVAQLGYFLLLLPLASLVAWQGVIYHGLAHGLAKTALFLAAGNLIRAAGSDELTALAGANRFLGGTLLAIAIAGVSLAGLPPSGGFVGKWWLIEAAMAGGQWWWAFAVAGGGLLTAAYVFRVLRCAFQEPTAGVAAPAAGRVTPVMVWVPAVLAFAALGLGFGGAALAPWLAIGGPGALP